MVYFGPVHRDQPPYLVAAARAQQQHLMAQKMRSDRKLARRNIAAIDIEFETAVRGMQPKEKPTVPQGVRSYFFYK